MKTGDKYKLSGGLPPASVSVEILKAADGKVTCKRLHDGEVVEVSREVFDRLRREMLEDDA